MSEKLIIKNFGPIKHAEIDLKKVTILIGPQGSGKSILVKILSIFKSKDYIQLPGMPFLHSEELNNIPEDFLRFNTEKLFSKFEEYGLNDLQTYVRSDTYFKYEGEHYSIAFSLKERGIPMVFTAKSSLIRRFYKPELQKRLNKNSKPEAVLRDVWEEFYKDKLEQHLSEHYNPVYFPAERAFFLMISDSIFSLINSKVNIPKVILNFGSLYETARKWVSSQEMPFLDVKYNYEGGRDMVTDNQGNSFPLSSGASGYQSSIPLAIIMRYLTNNVSEKNKGHHFIIEEPELNLYPLTQKGLVEYLIESINNTKNQLLITTHSPYVLTSLDNLVQVTNAFKENPDQKESLEEIIPKNQWIEFEDVSAYYMTPNGETINIMNNDNQSIGANKIDDVSESLGETFDKILNIRYQ